MLDNLITVEELSERLKVPKSWVYRKTMEKGPDSIPVMKVGKYIRFDPERVSSWLEERQKD